MKKPVVPVFVVGLLAICAPLFAGVKTDYSHSTNFGKYKTYSWIKAQAGNQLWEQRIKTDVNQALQAKGWREMPANGDASVSAFRSTREQRTLNTYYYNLGGGWLWGGIAQANTTGEETPVGTLVVDIFDTPTKKLIWRSVATDALTGNPKENAKKVTKTVEDMFKNFPPAPKG